MKQTKQIANRLREVTLNGLWIANTNYKDQLANLTWKQATMKIGTLNTMAALTFHINYYMAGLLNLFKGGSLDIRDKHSFDLSPIESQEDWELLLNAFLNNAEQLALSIELMPDEKLDLTFVNEKYGTYQRNIEAMIEHSYYHLGQVTLIKKMVLESEKEH